jgi:biopolymer transport protein ExbB/biopolymer transport protein TolQ
MDQTSFGPMDIWRTMGTMGHAVLIFLLLMSVYSYFVMIERYIALRTARKQSMAFVQAAKKIMPQGDMDMLFDEVKKYPRSHLARVYAAAIVDFWDYRKNPEAMQFEETMARAVEREGVTVVQELKRGLAGTVIGIMNAFFAMARAGQGGIGTVAGGIAEALVNTAVGLFVALPAVWGFNYFLGRVERFSVEMTTTGSELVDYFIKRFGSMTWKSAAADR